MDRKKIIGFSIATLAVGVLWYANWKPKKDRKDLIRLFVEKNYSNFSEQLTQAEIHKLEDAIFNLSDKEQKILLQAYKGKDAKNMDELSRILDKLRPIMDVIKPAFDIKRIEYGKKEITLFIKNAITPNLIVKYDGNAVINLDVPLVNAPTDGGQAVMNLRYRNGKLAAFENGKKIQEEEILPKKIALNTNIKK